MTVIWTAQARADRDAILDYILESNPVAALRLAETLLVTGDSLATFPHRGRPGRAEGTRELVAVWPYILVYQTDGAAVTILRLWHGAQDR